ncbi:hypothetical protein D3C72_1998030 [compost metagenome]
MGRNRPAVILAGLGQIDLIAATRAVLVGPQLTGPGVERCALLITVTKGPDFRAYVVLADKGVVFGHGAIREDAHDLALQLVQVLGRRALVVFTQRDE